ncbi:hypothetical protein PR048_000499 [Dryococelus australis]|uniref:Uncharacterized protein n=1 Tax=Dryococelus australis TaxID=614101 RepID=A0ABQ9IES6_9NEOP|nr:hypothetical protein PR048_000499 [Dryococelus australis]
MVGGEQANRSTTAAPSPYLIFNSLEVKVHEASEKQSSDTRKTLYDRVKRCRERKIKVKASERVNVDRSVRGRHALVDNFLLVAVQPLRLHPATPLSDHPPSSSRQGLSVCVTCALCLGDPSPAFVPPRMSDGSNKQDRLSVPWLDYSHLNRVRSPAGSRVGIVPDGVAGRWVFTGISRPPCRPRISLTICTRLTSPSIGSQDLDVENRPNLFTHRNKIFCFTITASAIKTLMLRAIQISSLSQSLIITTATSVGGIAMAHLDHEIRVGCQLSIGRPGNGHLNPLECRSAPDYYPSPPPVLYLLFATLILYPLFSTPPIPSSVPVGLRLLLLTPPNHCRRKVRPILILLSACCPAEAHSTPFTPPVFRYDSSLSYFATRHRLDSVSSHPDSGFPGFSVITPKAMADSFPNPSSPCNLHQPIRVKRGELQWRGKREIPEKIYRPAASSGTIAKCKSLGTYPPRIEPDSPWREASSLTSSPPS